MFVCRDGQDWILIGIADSAQDMEKRDKILRRGILNAPQTRWF